MNTQEEGLNWHWEITQDLEFLQNVPIFQELRRFFFLKDVKTYLPSWSGNENIRNLISLINQHSLARESCRNPTPQQIFGHAKRTSYAARHDCRADLSRGGKPRVVH